MKLRKSKEVNKLFTSITLTSPDPLTPLDERHCYRFDKSLLQLEEFKPRVVLQGIIANKQPNPRNSSVFLMKIPKGASDDSRYQ